MDTLEAIYEAAISGMWKPVFESIAQQAGARAAMICRWEDGLPHCIGSDLILEMMEYGTKNDYLRYNTRTPRLLASEHCGFLTDLDLHSLEEVQQNRLYQDVLYPFKLFAGAATHIPGAGRDQIVFEVGGFESFGAAKASVPVLDAIRPHLARALTLSSRLGLERATAMTGALQAIGVPAAVLTGSGILRAANSSFQALLGSSLLDLQAGLRLRDSDANTLFQRVLAMARAGLISPRSIPIKGLEGDTPRIMHILPVVGTARDVFTGDSNLIVLTGDRGDGPHPSLLQALFDLTPAEARVAKALAAGRQSADIAVDAGVSIHTVRNQVKAILSKTGTSSQANLTALLKNLSVGSVAATPT